MHYKNHTISYNTIHWNVFDLKGILHALWPSFFLNTLQTRPGTTGSGKNVTEEQGDSRGRIQTVVVSQLL